MDKVAHIDCDCVQVIIQTGNRLFKKIVSKLSTLILFIVNNWNHLYFHSGGEQGIIPIKPQMRVVFKV